MATKIYEGRYSNSSAQILLVERGKVYSGRYSNSSDEIKHVNMTGLLFKEDKVYRGKYTNSSRRSGVRSAPPAFFRDRRVVDQERNVALRRGTALSTAWAARPCGGSNRINTLV